MLSTMLSGAIALTLQSINQSNNQLDFVSYVSAQSPRPIKISAVLENGAIACDMANDPAKLAQNVAIGLIVPDILIQIMGAYEYICPQQQQAYLDALAANGEDVRDPSNDAQ